jgi:hypothetical protein
MNLALAVLSPMPSAHTSITQASGSSFSSGSIDLSVDQHLFNCTFPQSIRKRQAEDGDIVSEILVGLNLKQLSAREDFIEFCYVIYFLWYFLFLE